MPRTRRTLSVRLLGRLRGRRLRRAASASPGVTPRRSSRCWPSAPGHASATRSPPTSGRTSMARRRPRFARRCGSSGRASSAAGVDPGRLLEVGQDTLGLRPELRARHSTSSAFETLVADGPRRGARALALYRGDLAEGLGHECFAADRERLSDLYEDALVGVAEARLAAGDVAGAREAATQAARPRSAPRGGAQRPHRRVRMAGSRSQVVRQYRRLCEVLRAELAVAPAARDRRDLPGGDRQHHGRSRARAAAMAPRWRAAARCSIARRSPGSSPRAPDPPGPIPSRPLKKRERAPPRCGGARRSVPVGPGVTGRERYGVTLWTMTSPLPTGCSCPSGPGRCRTGPGRTPEPRWPSPSPGPSTTRRPAGARSRRSPRRLPKAGFANTSM